MSGTAPGAGRLLRRAWAVLTGGARPSPASHTRRLAEIREREASFGSLDDAALREEVARLRAETKAGEPSAALRTAFFALASELAHRTLGLRPFDVQLLGALALDEGCVVEMAAGEGKTLAAVPAVALGALAGRGFHILTANDYLAGRDAGWMGPLYGALGLAVGHVAQNSTPEERRAAYAADVTYLAATEAGFDYLRDRLACSPAELVQRPFHAALVDEVDSILIDEARVPLVIAGGNALPEKLVLRATKAVAGLEAERDFTVDHALRRASLTDEGIARAENALGCGDLFAANGMALLSAVNVALHAAAVLRRNVDYIVRDGTIRLVDEFKGRVSEQRRWPDGVHGAVEAKEGLRLTREGRILGTITLQSFIGLYPRVAGMTGTAATQADEFRERYGLEVVVIPPHRPCIRQDHRDLVFLGREAKERALEEDIAELHALGRPVLVGTASVEESERLAARLQAAEIPCRVLNARNDALEATIVADAGDVGAVTISTNMAGRGTDIKLGGAREERAAAVRELGGLFVAGTNRHEARRIDLQLRGRAGRQGDPGESRFYISLEDELFARYGLKESLPPELAASDDRKPLADPRVGREIERAQRILEGRNATVRRSLWRYDYLIEKQRRVLEQLRDEVLAGSPYLAERSPARHAELAALRGEAAVEDAERRIVLAQIDRHWADHLAEIQEVREGIVLRVVARQDPLFEFQKIAVARFAARQEAIERDSVEAFERTGSEGADTALDGAGTPGATWTYLMDESTYATPDGGFMRGLVSLLKRNLEKK
jgi:preprotein translocase subunit SecA